MNHRPLNLQLTRDQTSNLFSFGCESVCQQVLPLQLQRQKLMLTARWFIDSQCWTLWELGSLSEKKNNVLVTLTISLDFTSLLLDIKCVSGKTNTTVVLKLQWASEGHIKTLLGPICRVSDSVCLGWPLTFSFLTGSQVMWTLLVHGPCFDNHWSYGNLNAASVWVGWEIVLKGGGSSFASFN